MVLVGPETARRVAGRFLMQEIGQRQLKNISEEVMVYRILGKWIVECKADRGQNHETVDIGSTDGWADAGQWRRVAALRDHAEFPAGVATAGGAVRQALSKWATMCSCISFATRDFRCRAFHDKP